LTSPAYLKTRTVQIDDFMAALPPDPAIGVIILDACRDNPLARTLAASLPKSRSTSFRGSTATAALIMASLPAELAHPGSIG
jgi:uncharacterized caspase-like protein